VPSGKSSRSFLAALPWIGPTLLLMVAIVFFPAGYMVWTSFRDVSEFGVDRGPAGFENFQNLLEFDPLPRVLVNTVLWVVGVVALTVLISLALAQLLDKAFPGRRLVRLAVIVPWAASVVMTSVIFYYGLDPFYGLLNHTLVDLGILDQPYGFTKNAVPAFLASMGVAVFVSLPFTTYTLLAGLQTIPEEILEAAEIDGAGPWHNYLYVVLPNLRPALAVATIINIINVFNSLPILQVITGSIAGFSADTTTTLTFKLIRQNQQIDTAAAMSVLNFALIIAVIAIYVRLVRPTREIDR
jgi:multiple sugar transport system permease protein